MVFFEPHLIDGVGWFFGGKKSLCCNDYNGDDGNSIELIIPRVIDSSRGGVWKVIEKGRGYERRLLCAGRDYDCFEFIRCRGKAKLDSSGMTELNFDLIS